MFDVQRQGWSIEQLNEQSVNKPSDEMMRKVLRSDKTMENANERDMVGDVKTIDILQEREEAKNQ
ncbi:MAG: hypothetical protein H0T08_03890 [Acidobacteria bacterium]|jgi:hypothetical protein|nr:hypothetical protein [Acidobacteriota bacterium]